MENFILYNPTKLYFGKDQIFQLKNELYNYKNILLVYGGGSIKRYGLYDEIIKIIKTENKKVYELANIEPNPKLTSVKEGIDIVEANDIDFILAVGGGSVIDCAKAISISAKSNLLIEDILSNKVMPKSKIPVGTILTLAATGSEMNPRCVISDSDNNLKLGIGNWQNDLTFPVFSICDPTYTLTVPRNQTVNGIVDIISHVLEQYFNNNDNSILGDHIAEGIIKTMIDLGPKLLNDLSNYSLRETMLICSTLAWNGLLRSLSNNGDWACHRIEHALSAVYDIPHGEGLAIVIPIWMEFSLQYNKPKLVKFARNIFNVTAHDKTDEEVALEGIKEFKLFLNTIGAPSNMKYYNITNYNLDDLVDKTMLGEEIIGQYVKLNSNDVKEILKRVF